MHLMELLSMQSTEKPIFLAVKYVEYAAKIAPKDVYLFIAQITEFLILSLLNSRRFINFSFIYHSYQTTAIIGALSGDQFQKC